MYFNGINLVSSPSSESELLSGLGWAQYGDDEYTSSNLFVVNVGDRLKLPNNGNSNITKELPTGVTELYDSTNQKIIGVENGDGYLLRINFKAFTDNNNGYAELSLDIGGTQGEIIETPVIFPRGTGSNNVRPYTSTTLTYSLGTFVANGGDIYIEGVRGTTSIYDITYVIQRTYIAKENN